MTRKTQPPEQAPGPLLDRDGLLEPEELSDYLRVPVSTLDQWASKGGGPLYHKVGTHRRYHPADVKAWLLERRLAATGTPCPADVQLTNSDPMPIRPRKDTRRRAGTRGVGIDPSSAA